MNTQLNTQPTDPATDAPATQPAAKQPYEPPKATFVPLKLEERLLSCNWRPYVWPYSEWCGMNCASPSSS